MRYYKAFTLIELLVVIAIIAILAALLFPVFTHARAKAEQSACLSQKKQIGTGWLMYMDDYDDMVPLFVVFNVPGGAWPLHTILDPYIRNRQVFGCPTSGGGNYIAYSVNTGCPMGYAQYAAKFSNVQNTKFPPNGGLGRCPSQSGNINQDLWVPSIGEIPLPVETIAVWCAPTFPYCGEHFVDSNSLSCTVSCPWWQLCGVDDPPTLAGPRGSASYMVGVYYTNPHQEGTNYVFVDGHGKWYRPMQTVLPKDLWTRLK